LSVELLATANMLPHCAAAVLDLTATAAVLDLTATAAVLGLTAAASVHRLAAAALVTAAAAAALPLAGAGDRRSGHRQRHDADSCRELLQHGISPD
jgi:hypothetical protein